MKEQIVLHTSIREFQTILKQSYSSHTVILLSSSAAERYCLTDILTSLTATGAVIWISDFSANPTQQDIIYGLRQIANHEFHKILAIGGGSAIDLAKGILAMYPLYQEYIMQVPSYARDRSPVTSIEDTNEDPDRDLRKLFTQVIREHNYRIKKTIEWNNERKR